MNRKRFIDWAKVLCRTRYRWVTLETLKTEEENKFQTVAIQKEW